MTKSEIDTLREFALKFLVTTDFVVVERAKGLRFVIHPKENCGHNKAHVHVESANGHIEIDLKTFEVINASGSVSPKKIKFAVEFVSEHQRLFIDNWNEFTNGVQVTI